MKSIKVKKIRRQCFVPGCRNYDSFMVHRTNEPWPTVIMCAECAKELNSVLFPAEEPEKPEDSENKEPEKPEAKAPTKKPQTKAAQRNK